MFADLYKCDVSRFTRHHVRKFMNELCVFIDMEPVRLHIWDYDNKEERAAAPVHLAGISAVQFIVTSTIILHTLDKLEAAYLNVFSCKDFGHGVTGYIDVAKFAKDYFRAQDVTYNANWRGDEVYRSVGLTPPEP